MPFTEVKIVGKRVGCDGGGGEVGKKQVCFGYVDFGDMRRSKWN